MYQPWDQAPEIWPIRCKRLAIYLGLRAPFRSLGHRAQGRFPKWVHGARTRFARFRGSQAEFDRLRRRAPHLWGADDLDRFYGCGTWDNEGLAEEHDKLDEQEEGGRGGGASPRAARHERVLRLRGLRPPAVRRRTCMYSYGGGYFGDDGAGA